MRYSILFVFVLLLTERVLAKEEEEGWGLSLGKGTSSLTVGGRLQGISGYSSSQNAVDLYMRRARVNLQYQLEKFHLIYIDLRNDNSNKEDQGEGNFAIGDAFYEIPIDIDFIDNLTLFRSKVDVSYSQTASSKDLIHPNRERISDYAANFIVHNRRASNIQINGGNKWMTYQLVVADGIQSDAIDPIIGNVAINNIMKQSVAFGGKVRFFLWNPLREKAEVQETYYQAMRTFSIGFGFFNNRSITYQLSNGIEITDSRELYNLEISFALDCLRILAEGFIFDGDVVNLENNLIGRSQGAYLRAEYILGNTAPFVGLQSFERVEGLGSSYEKTQMIGVNYYAARKSRRYGISFKNYDYGKMLNQVDHEEIMTYMLIDY